jgi:Zn ribbon nucleic-acid-binding protein
MIIAAAGAMRPVNTCPRCNTPDGIQRLLTSMVRYYACNHCDFRWQVSRHRVNHDEMDVERADSVLPVFSRD